MSDRGLDPAGGSSVAVGSAAPPTEDAPLGAADDAAARAARKLGVVARCVRAECKLLLAEADSAAVGDGPVADMAVLGSVLAALGHYVRFGDDPAERLRRHGGESRARSAERIAARVAVESERKRLDSDALAAHDAASLDRPGTWDTCLGARDKLIAFNREHPPLD